MHSPLTSSTERSTLWNTLIAYCPCSKPPSRSTSSPAESRKSCATKVANCFTPCLAALHCREAKESISSFVTNSTEKGSFAFIAVQNASELRDTQLKTGSKKTYVISWIVVEVVFAAAIPLAAIEFVAKTIFICIATLAKEIKNGTKGDRFNTIFFTSFSKTMVDQAFPQTNTVSFAFNQLIQNLHVHTPLNSAAAPLIPRESTS